MLINDDPGTNNPLLRRYYKLRTYLGMMDPVHLNQMYHELLQALQDSVELSSEANFKEQAARHAYDIVKGEASNRLRSMLVAGKEPSEARIDKLLPLEPDVQEARSALDDARQEAEVCNGLNKSMEIQARLLGKMSDMVNSGYMSPSVALDQRRAELRQAYADHLEPQEGHVGRPTR